MESPRTIRVVAAVIEQDGRYLITQRRPTALLPLLWEFPGGKVEDSETDAEALKREVFHRLGVEVGEGNLVLGVADDDGVDQDVLDRRADQLGRGETAVGSVAEARFVGHGQVGDTALDLGDAGRQRRADGGLEVYR